MTNLTGGGGAQSPRAEARVTVQAQLFYFAMLVIALLTLVTSIILDRSASASACGASSRQDAALRLGIKHRATRRGVCAFERLCRLAGAVYASWVTTSIRGSIRLLISVKPS